jgi:hypothetical protein
MLDCVKSKMILDFNARSVEEIVQDIPTELCENLGIKTEVIRVHGVDYSVESI